MFDMGLPAVEFAGCWVELGLSVEEEMFGTALADWYFVGPGSLWWSNILNSAHPLQRLRPEPGWRTKTLSATWLRRKGRKKENMEKILK